MGLGGGGGAGGGHSAQLPPSLPGELARFTPPAPKPPGDPPCAQCPPTPRRAVQVGTPPSLPPLPVGAQSGADGHTHPPPPTPPSGRRAVRTGSPVSPPCPPRRRGAGRCRQRHPPPVAAQGGTVGTPPTPPAVGAGRSRVTRAPPAGRQERSTGGGGTRGRAPLRLRVASGVVCLGFFLGWGGLSSDSPPRLLVLPVTSVRGCKPGAGARVAPLLLRSPAGEGGVRGSGEEEPGRVQPLPPRPVCRSLVVGGVPTRGVAG